MKTFEMSQFVLFSQVKTTITDLEFNGVIATLFKELAIESFNYENANHESFNDDVFGLVYGDYNTTDYSFKALFLTVQQYFTIEETELKLNSIFITNGSMIIMQFQDEDENPFYFYFEDVKEILIEQIF